MTIHTIGDSHAYLGSDVCVHHIGAKLCFSIGRDGIEMPSDIRNGDTVIFCFGEIDCRCHIHKHITKEKDYKQIIDQIVIAYFESIKRSTCSYEDLKVCIYNVVPAVEKNITTYNSPTYPFIGTNNDRKKYVLYFNTKLKEFCVEYNYLFFDVYSSYINRNGFLTKSMSDGHVHIKDKRFIKEFIEANLLH